MTRQSWTLQSLTKALSKTAEVGHFCDMTFGTLGGGAYRNVYKVTLEDGTDVALKVGSSWANAREVERYKKASNPPEMAAILAYDERYPNVCAWVIMEFVPQILSRVDSAKYNYWWDLKEEKFENLRTFIRKHNIGDTHCANIGFRQDGSLVIVDYAG